MRLDNWEKALNEHLETIGPFEWGTNDCCMFAVGCVEAITGVDYGKPYRGYKSKIGAARRLSEGGGVDGIATECLGKPKEPIKARRGDVVMFDVGQGNSLGICLGVKIAAISEQGLMFINMDKATKAWSV